MSEIKKLNKLLSTKQISSVELTKTFLDTCQSEQELNSFITVTADFAMETAKKIDKKIGNDEEISLIAGIPMSLKDNILTKGIRTTAASKMLDNFIPIYSAEVWQKLENQGAVLIGKTNLDEFAMGSTTETSFYGPSLNPLDLKYVAGGSSGGSAASVASNQSVYSLGSDTGGSVRQPASYCGIVGLKPSYGSISRSGVIAYASSFDQVGILAKTVEDAAIIFDELNFYDKNDQSSSNKNRQKTITNIDKPINGLRIGISNLFLKDLAPDVAKSIENSISVFKSLGAKIVELDLDLDLINSSLSVYYILTSGEAASNMGRYDGIRYGYSYKNDYEDINDFIAKTRAEALGSEVKRRIMLGNYILTSNAYDAYYNKAQNLRLAIKNSFSEAFKACDAILTPTSTDTAPKLGALSVNPVDNYQKDSLTVPANITGLPAISIPCGFDCNNLPIGMQLIGNLFEEEKILNFAHIFEKTVKNTKEQSL